MVTFPIPSMETRTCEDCSQEYWGSPSSTRCGECRLYHERPELAPKYWTWTGGGPNREWRAVCTWPQKEPFPEAGLQITVHRKDGSTSQETVKEFEFHRYDTAANLKVVCFVS